jgi:hypothetical protein
MSETRTFHRKPIQAFQLVEGMGRYVGSRGEPVVRTGDMSHADSPHWGDWVVWFPEDAEDGEQHYPRVVRAADFERLIAERSEPAAASVPSNWQALYDLISDERMESFVLTPAVLDSLRRTLREASQSKSACLPGKHNRIGANGAAKAGKSDCQLNNLQCAFPECLEPSPAPTPVMSDADDVLFDTPRFRRAAPTGAEGRKEP